MNHSTLKKKGRRTSTSRPKSAPSRMSNGVKYRGSLSSAHTRREPAKRIPLQEYSINTLRNSQPYWTLSQSTSSFTGLNKNRVVGAPYASTSHYLRHLMVSEAEKQLTIAETGRQSMHSSLTYKTSEDYHDEVITLKKQIQDLTNENAVLKLKTRKTEEEYFMRKQRDSELHCMDSTKVEQTLRQRLATLEKTIRDKDVTLSKLQNDLKTTKLEEMKVKLDVYADEIRRLKRCKENRGKKLSSVSSKAFVTEETPGRMKSLMTTLRKMGVEKARLIQENKLLKQDLHRSMEEKADKLIHPNDNYDDMTKKELLSTVAKLQQKIERLESVDDSRIRVRKSSRADIEGKLSLEGGLAERLDQLDKRETELLEEVAKKTSIIVQLKEDRSYYREKNSENEREVKRLRKEIDGMQLDLSGRHSNNRGDIQRPLSASGRHSPRPSVNSRRSSRSDQGQPPKVETFRRNRAAKVIQRGWRQHARYSYDDDDDKGVALIQSTLKGHRNRRLNLSRLRGFMADEDEDDEEGSDEDAVERIQSTFKGHRFRSLQLARRQSNTSSVRSVSPRGGTPASVHSPRNYHHRSSLSGGAMREEDDDRYSEISMRSNRRGSIRTNLKDVNSDRFSTVSARTSLVSGRLTPVGHARSQLSEKHDPIRRLNSVADDSDDDDDITLRSSRRRPIF